MPRVKINYDDFKVKAFLDTNIILEGRPLTELPWQEIDPDGPIIVLITPTAIKEVDSKKQDGRIGRRARDFNRLISSVAAGGPPIILRDHDPHVELALAYAVRIPWDQHDDLDPDDGDSCIVAEMLYAKEMTSAGKLLVSHDIKPIAFGANYDLETLHVSDNWLRDAEPSPNDKELQKLKGKLADYEAKEPDFEIKIDVMENDPVSVRRVQRLTDDERNSIERKILAANPKKSQSQGSFDIMYSYDSSYDRRFEAYRKQIPIFIKNYEQHLERLFNQTRFKLKVKNIGKMQADNLLVEIRASSGWLHDRYVFVSAVGPTVPKPRNDKFFNMPKIQIPTIPSQVGRHEIAFKDDPAWNPYFSVTCKDFRHGQDWIFDGVIGFDPHATDTKIIVRVTASNFRGTKQEIKPIMTEHKTVHVSELVDLDSLRIVGKTPIKELLGQKDYEKAIDFAKFEEDSDFGDA